VPYNTSEAYGKIGDYTKAKYGQGFNDLLHGSAVSKAAGVTGDQWDDAALTKAYGAIDQYGQQQGWKAQPTPAPAPTPAAPPPAAPAPAPAPSPAPTPADGSVPPAGGPAPVPTVTPPAVGQLTQPMAPNPMQEAGQQAILKLLGDLQQPASLQDDTLRPVADAYKSRRQRGYERERSALAEMAAQDGTLGAGSFDTSVLGALQGANSDVAGFEADLLYGETKDRRDQLQQALNVALTTGNQQQAMDIQRQLAAVDAELQRYDTDVKRELGHGEIDLRRQLGLSDLDTRRDLGFAGLDLNRLLGMGDLDIRGRALDQGGALGRGQLFTELLQTLLGNDQFWAEQGLDASQFVALLNQSAIGQLLGGFD
jgi:hypothetical protein